MSLEEENSLKKNIVISGVSSGIGKEMLSKLLANDSIEKVFALTSNSKFSSEFNHPKVVAIQLDYANLDFQEALTSEIGETPIHGVILNAGYLEKVEQGSISTEQIVKSFQVNTYAPIMIVQALLNNIEAGKAHIVAVGSMGGYQGASKFPGLSIYSASKSALSTYIECLAQELFSKGVRANTLALGAVDTKMLHTAFPGFKAPVTPEQMADYILDFLFKGGDYITGKVIPVSLVNPS